MTFFWWQDAAGTLLWAQWHRDTPDTPAPDLPAAVLPKSVLPKAVSPAPVSLSPVSLSPVSLSPVSLSLTEGIPAAAPTADPVFASTASCRPLPTVLSPVFSPARYREDARVWQPLADVAPGTGHARRVWWAILQIPLGETRSYGELAREVDSSPQAVGQACRHNPWPLFVPCHRVVGRRFPHEAGGYAGQRDGELLRAKRWLLAHEGAAIGHLGKCLPES